MLGNPTSRMARFTRARSQSLALPFIIGMLSLTISAQSARAGDTQVVFAETHFDENGIEVINWHLPQDASLQPNSQASFLIVGPSVTSSILGAQTVTSTIIFSCVNSPSGQIIPNCDLDLILEDVLDDGGHSHQGSRPLGVWNPPSGNSGADGMFRSTYTSPEVSGVINFRAEGTNPSGFPVDPFVDTISVEIAFLVPLNPGTNYNLIGHDATHPDNHYGNDQFNPLLVLIANRYAAKFPGFKIDYNDMSLRLGGIFDYESADWQPPHKSHRFGDDVDVRPVPGLHRAELRKIIKDAGVRTNLNEGNHWHLRK